MKIMIQRAVGLLALLALTTPGIQRAFGQEAGAPFLYRGHLFLQGSRANGSYDLIFSLFDVGEGGRPIAVPVTRTGTAVSNGLFHATLDFGAGPFTRSNYWLEIQFRPSGTSNAFTELTPRPRLKPSPYAHGPIKLKRSGIQLPPSGQTPTGAPAPQPNPIPKP